LDVEAVRFGAVHVEDPFVVSASGNMLLISIAIPVDTPGATIVR
jgi:hypothetical protein